MKRWMGWLMVALAGCSAESGALELADAIPPSTTCTFDATSTMSMSAGFFDPASNGPFILGLKLRNNLPSRINSRSTTIDGEEFRHQTSDLQLRGFDACWVRGDAASVAGLGSFDEGTPIECEKLDPSQRAFVASEAFLPEGGNPAAAAVDLVGLSALQASGIFGPSFDPRLIPIGDDPTLAARSPAWGGFPFAPTARVLVQLRAHSEFISGNGVLRSNQFVFPIDVCPRCIADICASQSTATCSQLSVSTTSPACLPFQGGEAITCVAAPGCT